MEVEALTTESESQGCIKVPPLKATELNEGSKRRISGLRTPVVEHRYCRSYSSHLLQRFLQNGDGVLQGAGLREARTHLLSFGVTTHPLI